MKLRGLARNGLWGAVISVITAAAPVAAQTSLSPGEGFGDRPRLGVGLVGSVPDVRGGAAAWALFDALGGMGLYVDFKGTLRGPADEESFISDLTVAEVEATPGQELSRNESTWWSANVAVLRALSPELMLYLGAGYAHQDLYARYVDTTAELDIGTAGWYWIRDGQGSGARVNILGGAFFRIAERVALQFGLESQPAAMTVGVTYTLPLRTLFGTGR